MLSLETFISALMLDESESRPIVIHSRAIYRLTGASRSVEPEELAEQLTKSMDGRYCLLFAANAMGPEDKFKSSDFLVASRNVDPKAMHSCLETLCDEPFSSCGSGECPEYVKDWVAVNVKGEPNAF